MPSIRPFTRLSALLVPLVLFGTGCGPTISNATPEDVPRLRSELQADPGDPVVQTRLGIALYRAERYGEAEEVLARAAESDEATGAAFLFLGLAQEAQEDWTEARDAYQTYLEVGRDDELRGRIRDRLALVIRKSLRQQAEQTLQQEEELSGREPTPRSVAVFPFQLNSDRRELEPLQVAMADMLVTDFGLVQSLRVLERAQVQSLLSEMALTEAGYTEPSTGARAGRLLQAEHVVQGALTTTGEDRLRFDADVLNTTRGSTTGQATAEEELQQLFDAEKEIVFNLLDDMQVELTPAEREAISENRAQNLLAFLEYGRGLQAMDRGDYQQATQFFNSAVSIDPGFAPAQAQQQEATQLEQASTTSASQVAQAAGSELGEQVVGASPAAPTGAQDDGDLGGTLANVDSGITGTNASTVLGSGTAGGGGGSAANDGTTQGTNDSGGKRNDPVQDANPDPRVSPTSIPLVFIIPNPNGSGGGR